MRVFFSRASVCGLLFLLAAGCSSLSDTLGISPPTHKLLDQAKAIRDAAPVPAPIGRELAKELLPSHIIQQGDTLVVQPVELDAAIRLPPDQPVQPDGAIDLGKYGRPVVVGKTVQQLEVQIAELIRDQEKRPISISVRLVGKPSDVYYVFGEVNASGSFPVTGHETVLDGIVAAGGLTRKASRDNIILSRPTVPDGCRVVYPVCWRQIVQLGDTTTNYQLQPGDRIYVPSHTFLESFWPSHAKNECAACNRCQVPCYGAGAGPGVLPAWNSASSGWPGRGAGSNASIGATGVNGTTSNSPGASAGPAAGAAYPPASFNAGGAPMLPTIPTPGSR
jgi:protein involved in polysaccharide export with SLBB domain